MTRKANLLVMNGPLRSIGRYGKSCKSIRRENSSDAAALFSEKIDGIPAYKLARKGEEVELKTKEVEINELVITDGTGLGLVSVPG